MSGKSFACRRCPPPYNPNHVDFAPRAAVILSHPPADALHPALSASRTSISPIGISDPVPVDTRYAPARRVPWPLPPTVARQLTFFFRFDTGLPVLLQQHKVEHERTVPGLQTPVRREDDTVEGRDT